MKTKSKDISIDTLRSYSSAFSRTVFSEIIEFGDFTHIDWLLQYEDNTNLFNTYFDYFIYLYSWLKKKYRCEYFFKNEIINQYIIKKLGTKDSIVFNEFRVGESVVDLAIMNGESKAFEIKTNFDSPKRLIKQLNDYCRLFNKVYIVISQDNISQYLDIIPDSIGILTLDVYRKQVKINTYRDALLQRCVDPKMVMKCLRATEYIQIVQEFYESLSFKKEDDLYDKCLIAIEKIPSSVLNALFIKTIKKRKSITGLLDNIPLEFRQMCLSLNLTGRRTEKLFNQLNNPINRKPSCICRI